MKQSNNISETASNMNLEWSSTDYFIMPDVVLPAYQGQDIHLDFFALFICIKGSAEMLINKISTEIEPFALYAFSPGNIITPKTQSPDCVFKTLAFTKDFLLKNNFKANDLERFDFFTQNQFNKINLNKDEVLSLVQLYDLLQVKKDQSQSIYFLEIIRSLFFTFLYEVQIIYSKKSIFRKSSNKREEELNKKFKELINTQAFMQHNLKFYADSLFITPKYLISVIKNSSGKTPGILIDEAIIDVAKQNLIHSNQTIGEIADYLQFSDNAAFSKFFKRYTDLSPSLFRKKYQL